MTGPTRVVVSAEGEVAARFAEQLNNPLTVVIANLDVALIELADLARERDIEGCAALEERLRDARAAAERLHRTVRDLGAGSPPPSGEPQRTDVSRESDATWRGRLLVIDDERLIAVAVARTLALEHEVTTVASAREALDALQRGARFDLILCDLVMPEVSGMELYAQLRRIEPRQVDRIVFLTGGPCTPGVRRFLNRIPNAHIEKPFDARELRVVVHRHLQIHGAFA